MAAVKEMIERNPERRGVEGGEGVPIVNINKTAATMNHKAHIIQMFLYNSKILIPKKWFSEDSQTYDNVGPDCWTAWPNDLSIFLSFW